ncbi:MAG: DUF2165 family protein [Pseudomonadota bacterium]
MLRITKVLLTLAVSAWGYVGALFNLLDWSGTLDAVQRATSMSTFNQGASAWQATANPLLIWIGALFILLSKLAAAMLCLIGAGRMWRARATDSATFEASKDLALAGCGVALLMLFGGFIVVAESYFELWRSDALRGPVLESAFRYAACIAAIGLYVGMREPQQ